MDEYARSLSMLNESGDTTLAWEPDADEEMLRLIEAKMAAGVTFYMVPPRKTNRGRAPKERPIKSASEPIELKQRALSVKDEDLSKLIANGVAKVVATPAARDTGTVRRARSAREVASGHSIGVQPRAGG